MRSSDTRKQNLKAWLDAEFGGKIADFCRYYSLPSAFASYLSQILNGGKAFGERAARNLEQQTKRPSEWLDRIEDKAADQPVFNFDPKRAVRLSEEDKALIESFIGLVLQRHEASRLAQARKRHAQRTDEVQDMAESEPALLTTAPKQARTLNINDRVRKAARKRSSNQRGS